MTGPFLTTIFKSTRKRCSKVRCLVRNAHWRVSFINFAHLFQHDMALSNTVAADTRRWFVKAELDHHLSRFLEEGFRLSQVAHLGEAELDHLGITKYGERLRFFQHARQFNGNAATTATATTACNTPQPSTIRRQSSTTPSSPTDMTSPSPEGGQASSPIPPTHFVPLLTSSNNTTNITSTKRAATTHTAITTRPAQRSDSSKKRTVNTCTANLLPSAPAKKKPKSSNRFLVPTSSPAIPMTAASTTLAVSPATATPQRTQAQSTSTAPSPSATTTPNVRGGPALKPSLFDWSDEHLEIPLPTAKSFLQSGRWTQVEYDDWRKSRDRKMKRERKRLKRAEAHATPVAVPSRI
eukprot:m.93915 g.93915  ORF g.93915 m.93915 type:complete len:352 (-) comp14996_c0_seq2:110-1165(-)